MFLKKIELKFVTRLSL